MVKNIFNSGKNKVGVGMKIPSWMITDEMKLTENYWMYAEAFGVDVPTTQSQSIQLRIPPRQTTRLTPLTPIPTAAEVEEMIVQDTIQLSIDELENQNDPDTSLDPESYKKSPEVEKTVVVSQPVNVIKEEDESTKDDYEFRRREKGKNVEESRHTPSLTTIRYPRIHSTLTRFLARKKFNVLAQHLQEVMEEELPNMVDDHSQSDVAKMIANATQQERENPQTKITLQINNAITNHVPSQIKFEGLTASNTPYRSSAIRLRDQDDPRNDAHPEGENSAKRQKTSEHETYVFGESSSG
nr:hypothetical protein [Tanacetum cinerariifolium]